VQWQRFVIYDNTDELIFADRVDIDANTVTVTPENQTANGGAIQHVERAGRELKMLQELAGLGGNEGRIDRPVVDGYWGWLRWPADRTCRRRSQRHLPQS
jgi:hypothetical protein